MFLLVEAERGGRDGTVWEQAYLCKQPRPVLCHEPEEQGGTISLHPYSPASLHTERVTKPDSKYYYQVYAHKCSACQP